MDSIGILLSIAGIQLLAAASPGPAFIVVSSASVTGSRRVGLPAACGVLLATTAWVLVSVLGLGVLLARLPEIHAALQVAGAVYLVWLGAKMLVGALRRRVTPSCQQVQAMSAWEAMRNGFVTNILNPKSIAYYGSIFAVLLPYNASPLLLAAAGATALSASTLWWIGVALFFASAPVRRTYQRVRRWIDGMMGVVLIGLGVRLACAR